MNREKTIFFDLEGPLSPQDNAYEVMKLIGEKGAFIFEVISKYDDIKSIEGRESYEPGDTLALIVPFLLLHGITEGDINRVSERAKIVDGAKDLFEKLQTENWDIYIISTSYKQHAYNVKKSFIKNASRKESFAKEIFIYNKKSGGRHIRALFTH